jgi:glycosyltransferase involved in cell wall biosynthesis
MVTTAGWPLVSVGVPVRNGEKFLARALDSLRESDYPNLEVIICDNASTDSTPELVKHYVDEDARFRYHRSESDLGAVQNFNKAFSLATGEYFRWLAHDDWCSSDYDSRCVAVMERNPGVVLVHAAQNVVRGDRVLAVTRQALEQTASPSPVVRIRCLSWRLRDPTAPVFGLMRRDALVRTGLIRNAPEPDRLLVHELALHGAIATLDDPLFFHYRGVDHALHYGEHTKIRRRSFEWLHPDNRNKRQMTTVRVLREHWDAIVRSDLARKEKLICWLHILSASVVRRPVSRVRRSRSARRSARKVRLSDASS